MSGVIQNNNFDSLDREFKSFDRLILKESSLLHDEINLNER